MVEVGGDDAEGKLAQRRLGEAGDEALVGEDAGAAVAVEGVGLALVVGDRQVEQAVAVVIPRRHSHAGLGQAALAVGGAGEQREVLEGDSTVGTATAVAEEEVRGLVVGDVEVDPAVVVEVGEGQPEPGAAGTAESRGPGGVVEGAVAAVQVEAVG